MKIKASFTPTIKLILWIMIVFFSISTIIGILCLFEVLKLEITKGQIIIILSFSPILCVASILLATIHYKVDEHNLRLKIGLIDIFQGKLLIERIANIVIRDNKLYLSYICDQLDPVIALISISPKHYQKLTDFLIAQNQQIVLYKENNETTNSQQ